MAGIPVSPVILASMAFAAIIATAFMMAYGSAADRRLRKRMDQVLLLEGPSAGGASVAAAAGSARPSTLMAATRKTRTRSMDEKLRQLVPNVQVVRLRLERAGFRITITTLLLICLAITVSVGTLVATYAQQTILVAVLTGLAAGISIPALVITMRGKRKAREFLADLPDTIDLIVRSVKSGLPVTEAIHAIARDMMGPAAEEFKKVSDQMRIGIPMDDALQRSVERMGLTDYAFLAVSLSITRRTGGNLSETLANLSRLLRSRQQMLLKIRALSSEARWSAIIIGVLPFVVMGVLLVLNPGYINTLFTDPSGKDVLMVGGVSLIMGFGIMAKMIRFDF